MATQFAFGKIVTSGLVLALDAADRNSYVSGSTSWRDMSGNGYTATILSPVFTTEGGGGFTSGVTNLPAATQSSPTQITLEATLRIATTVAFTGYLVYGGTGSGLNNKIFIRGSNGGNGLQIFVYGNTTTVEQLIGLGTYNVSTTKILAITLDNLGVARSYINGVFAQSASITNFISWQISNQTGDLFADYYSNVKVYNRALSAQEILQNYNAQKSRFGLT